MKTLQWYCHIVQTSWQHFYENLFTENREILKFTTSLGAWFGVSKQEFFEKNFPWKSGVNWLKKELFDEYTIKEL